MPHPVSIISLCIQIGSTRSFTGPAIEGTVSLVQDETLSNSAGGASSVGGFSFASTATTNTTFCVFPAGVGGTMSNLRSALSNNTHECRIVPFSGRDVGVSFPSPFAASAINSIVFQCYTIGASGTSFTPVADGENPFCDPFPGTGFEPATVSWYVA